MATYTFCECGHTEKKHTNKGKCLAYTPWPIERDNVSGERRCACKKLKAAQWESPLAPIDDQADAEDEESVITYPYRGPGTHSRT